LGQGWFGFVNRRSIPLDHCSRTNGDQGLALADHVEAHRSAINGVPVPGLLRELDAVARREEGLLVVYGHARSPQIAQRVAITGSQVSTVVLHNHTAEEIGYDRQPFYRRDLVGRHRHFQASP
jgi:hypothetical protein